MLPQENASGSFQSCWLETLSNCRTFAPDCYIFPQPSFLWHRYFPCGFRDTGPSTFFCWAGRRVTEQALGHVSYCVAFVSGLLAHWGRNIFGQNGNITWQENRNSEVYLAGIIAATMMNAVVSLSDMQLHYTSNLQLFLERMISLKLKASLLVLKENIKRAFTAREIPPGTVTCHRLTSSSLTFITASNFCCRNGMFHHS